MTKREKIVNLLFSLLAIAAIWIAWLVAYASVKNELVVPSIQTTVRELGALFGERAFWCAFGNTLLRTLEAFSISFALGLGCALLSLLKPVRAFLAPVVSVLRTVPTMALVLILLLWTSPAAAPVLIAMLVLFPAFYSAMVASLDEVRKEYGEMARAFRIPKGRQAMKIYLPLAAPPVLGQMGAVFSLGLKITVSGEVLAVTAKSLGGMMQQSALLYLNTARLMALTLMAILVGFLFEGVFYLLKKGIVRWQR